MGFGLELNICQKQKRISLAERRQNMPFDCTRGTALRGLSEVEAFLFRMPGLAFGDLLLFRQK